MGLIDSFSCPSQRLDLTGNDSRKVFPKRLIRQIIELRTGGRQGVCEDRFHVFRYPKRGDAYNFFIGSCHTICNGIWRICITRKDFSCACILHVVSLHHKQMNDVNEAKRRRVTSFEPDDDVAKMVGVARKHGIRIGFAVNAALREYLPKRIRRAARALESR